MAIEQEAQSRNGSNLDIRGLTVLIEKRCILSRVYADDSRSLCSNKNG
jgi:hypothetical protein